MPDDLHHKVNTSNLVHKLHTIGKQDSLPSLYLVAVKDLPPRVTALTSFKRDGLEDIVRLLDDFRMIRVPRVNITQNLKSFLVPALVV